MPDLDPEALDKRHFVDVRNMAASRKRQRLSSENRKKNSRCCRLFVTTEKN